MNESAEGNHSAKKMEAIMKKTVKFAAIVAALAVGLSGCSKKTTAGKEEKLQTLKFGVSPGTIRTALVLTADRLGYYKEEGVDVELVQAANPTAALTSISTNKNDLDIWGTGIVPDLNFIANGSDLVIFEGTAAEGGAIISRKGEASKYKNLSKYRGIKIATVRADTAWVVSRGVLKNKYGIDVDKEIDVIEIDSQVNVAEAVRKGEADLGFLPAEFATKYKDLGIETVYEVGELEPLYVCCRQVTSRKVLQEKKEELVRFTVANLRALEYYSDEANHPDVVKALADYSDQTEDYVNTYLFKNRTIMTLDPNKPGVVSYYNSLVDAGYFTGKVDIENHVDTAIYQEALDRILARDSGNIFFKNLKASFKA